MPARSKTRPLVVVAATALVLATVALAATIALATKDDSSPSMSHDASMPMGGSNGGMSGMSPEDMEHMKPLPMGGITDAPSDQGGTAVRGVRRNGALEFALDARPVRWRIGKEQKLAAWAYDGLVPGPMIRVPNGERVRIKFTNRLPEATTVHWHGIDVPNRMDGVPDVTQKPIEPGASFSYEFVARPAGEPDGAGTFLYHSHVDEDRQMSAGLYGALIIDPAAGRAATREETLVFSEWTADANTGRTRGVMQMEGMLPNFFTINGKAFPDTELIKVRAGELVRLRLVNAGQFAHPIHVHGTSFRVVARDGHPARDGGLRDTVSLESGERADIEFRLPRGRWLLHCHIGHHLTNDGHGPGGLVQVIQAG